MAFLYVTEYATMGSAINGVPQIAARPGVARQKIAISGVSTQSAAFSSQTKFIRVHTDAICCTLVSNNPTADTNSDRMAADQTEYWGVQPGDKIAVISAT